MFISRIAILVFMLALINVQSANSQENQDEALNLIYRFADKMCIAMPIEGDGSNYILNGSGNAELNGLLKKLTELGIDGAIFFQRNEYKGVLQKDLLSALKTTTDCRLKIFMGLQDKLISNESKFPHSAYSDDINPSASFQYPIQVQDKKTGEAISNARVFIEVLGNAPINVFTDSNGFTRIFIGTIRIGEPGRLTVQADGYEPYIQNIDLNKNVLTHIVQLEPE